jgi:hypothetical protein
MRSGESLYGSELNYDELMTFFWFFIVVILNTDNFINKSNDVSHWSGILYNCAHFLYKSRLFFDEYLRMKLSLKTDI